MKEEYFNKTVGVVMASLLPQNEKRELIDSIRAMEKETKNNGWIPVEQDIPKVNPSSEFYETVNISLKDGTVTSGCYRNKDEEWWGNISDGEYENITEKVIAWQPLPEPFRDKE